MSEAIGYDFKICLADSMESTHLNWLDEEYKKSFSFNGKMIRIERVEDLERQKNGIDALVYFEDGMVFTIQEKKVTKKYYHILLELESYDKFTGKSNRPGWLYTRQSDFLAYSQNVPKLDYKMLYIFPFALLKSAWQRNENTWRKLADDRKDGFRYTDADNYKYNRYSYTTRCIAIPPDKLVNAIRLLAYYTPICGKVAGGDD